ncbi:uncharacterized protein VICG_02049 [Vittaforma corneae ATCC 50505]|uniref:Uncharacterized protein n=1 Tax=Vittaforma corneae (strain ATCC 50505) TaxID=993615 RepID=L2GJU7_VITCO|nr:uncharacterized protein VICG_02049 [Vittaforma corneae ATCC 50505]ELA40909.1 hypothetical protein VICG_02049 [Vittaforma corneae ATCC 50505]
MDVENELKVYYRELFPLQLLYETLEINGRREVSFFTSTGSYMRYLTFDSAELFREKLELVNPRKIDLGPVYDIKPSKSNGAVPVAREIVFDIDLTDYPRECCKDKKICNLCYEKIKCAINILDYSLRTEFGFTSYGFVFSGRRGVHCWVLEMKELPTHVRNDIFKFFQNVVDKNLFVQEYNNIMGRYGDADLVKNFFPRIDKQVTVSMNHLIKMPFSVHPDTFNISVPLDPNSITELEDIPTLSQAVASPAVLEPYYEVLKTWKRQ